ncbi:MAG: LacI family transcriptional regulator [Propionibacteriaceae bacterium]|nr:LacI family transcriptional regulator [Propionibacteriaceae bacterium]
MPTLDDVAQLAGVSASTVSRTFSDGTVSPATRQRVLEAAEQLGYTSPNRAARALADGRTRQLGLVLPDLANPFARDIAKSISRIAYASGYLLVLADADDSPVSERELIAQVAGAVDGLILLSPRIPTDELANRVDPAKTVLAGRMLPGFSCVANDEVDGIRQALIHLAALGHTQIAYVNGPADSASEKLRLLGLEKAGDLGLDVKLIRSSAPSFTGGVGAADQVIASGASAVIAFNDVVAIGLLSRFKTRNVLVPQQISVVGIDDVAVAQMAEPPLTTISSHRDRLGVLAAQTLIHLVESGAPLEPVQLSLTPELIVRASTDVPPPGK